MARKIDHKAKAIIAAQVAAVRIFMVAMYTLPLYTTFAVLLHVEHVLGFGPFDTFIWTGPAAIYYFIRIRKMNRR